MRLAIGNLWLFKKPLLKKMSGNIGMNAIIRTTLVTTIISGGIKENVVPSIARATINCRILPGETIDETEQFIRRQINDERVKIKRGSNCSEASTFTPVEGKAYKTIESLVTKFFPGAVPAPMLVISASDARYFRNISRGVINFAPSIDSEGLHGVNEYRSIKDFKRMVRFYATFSIFGENLACFYLTDHFLHFYFLHAFKMTKRTFIVPDLGTGTAPEFDWSCAYPCQEFEP